MPNIRLLFCVVIFGCHISASVGLGQPTNENPQLLLQVRSQSPNKALINTAEQLLSAAAEEVGQHEENQAANRYNKANKRDIERIARTSLKLSQVLRMSQRIMQLREPAGTELELRCEFFQQRLRSVVGAYKQAEGAPDLIKAAAETLRTVSFREARSVERISELIQRNKLEQAETEIDEIYDELHMPAVFQQPNYTIRFYGEFLPLRNSIDAKMREQREALAVKQLTELRVKTLPRYEAILGLVTTSVDSVKTSGQANWAGQMLDGPALLAAWRDGWQKTNVKMMQCYAIDRLREVNVGQSPPSDLDQLKTSHAEFEQAMLQAMVDVIAADAARVSAEDAPSTYLRYLDAAAGVCAAAADDQIASAFQPALEQLAQRSPELAQQVSAYESATREALRWRERNASAQARRHRRDAQALADLLTLAEQPAALKNRPENTNPDVNKFVFAAPPMVLDVADLTMGKTTVAEFVSPDGDLSMSRQENSIMARMSELPAPDAELAELKHDLLVSEAHPALTLAAATAIKSAELGYFRAVGGEVSAVAVDSILMHNLLSNKTAQFAIGSLPDLSRATASDTLWRFDVTPKWARHDYFFVVAP